MFWEIFQILQYFVRTRTKCNTSELFAPQHYYILLMKHENLVLMNAQC